jgi:hypothetical protein
MEIVVKIPISPDLSVQRSILSCQRFSFQCFSFIHFPISPPSSLRQGYDRLAGPTQWLFQEPPAESKFLAAMNKLHLSIVSSLFCLLAAISIVLAAESPVYRSPYDLAYSPNGKFLAVSDRSAGAAVLIVPAQKKVARDALAKFVRRRKVHELRKNRLADIHARILSVDLPRDPHSGPIPTSNR